MKPVVIFGGGDQARTAYVYLSKDSPYQVVAFTAHQALISQDDLLGLEVVPFERLEELYPPEEFALFVAIGYERINKTRAKIYNECRQKGYELVSYCSSKAIHWGEIDIGDNCFILENSTIQPFARIGNNVVVGIGSVIGHDVCIGDHCFISPGAVITGAVSIGPYSFIGANATLRNGVTIGAESVIGAGAIILKDTQPQQVYLARGTEAAAVSSVALSPFFGRPKISREGQPADS